MIGAGVERECRRRLLAPVEANEIFLDCRVPPWTRSKRAASNSTAVARARPLRLPFRRDRGRAGRPTRGAAHHVATVTAAPAAE